MKVTLRALRHVSSAVHHAEALADEADDLADCGLAQHLRLRAQAVAVDLEAAVAAIDDVEPARLLRGRSHRMLLTVYGDATHALELALPAEESSRLCPGGHLDVAERARYRLRHIPDDAADAVLDIRAGLERAMFTYDAAVDSYLGAVAAAATKRDRVIVRSQALRLELDRAKHALLLRCEPGTDEWRRIRSRTVRTKRARWLDEAKALRLFAGLTG